MNPGFLKRLEDLEKKNFKEPLLIIARRMDSGEEFNITMREFLETPGLEFVKVIKGGNLEDLDAFLAEFDRRIKEGAVV